jgi:hypothetical protein
MASVVYKRLLARVERLTAGEWTDLTASGRPALCCSACSAVFELPATHRVNDDGLVVPAVRCGDASCREFGYVRLENWSESVVR